MKRVGELLALLVLGCSFNTVPRYSVEDTVGNPDLVFNGSFEVGIPQKTALPPHWYVYDQPEGVVQWQQTDGHDQPRCLHILHPDKPVDIVSDAFLVSTHDVYLLRAFVRTDGTGNAPVTVRFWGFNSAGKKINKFTEKFVPDTQWKEVSVTAGFLKPNAMFGRVIITIPAGKEDYWLDDVTCNQVYKFKK
ncbi:MAG: hypothetical protein J7K89_06525 [Candidatus Cloacimonetes bacterium]|nr:hypothetical protein [Candidatus Cloacimonadota bacterium]